MWMGTGCPKGKMKAQKNHSYKRKKQHKKEDFHDN